MARTASSISSERPNAPKSCVSVIRVCLRTKGTTNKPNIGPERGIYRKLEDAVFRMLLSASATAGSGTAADAAVRGMFLGDAGA